MSDLLVNPRTLRTWRRRKRASLSKVLRALIPCASNPMLIRDAQSWLAEIEAREAESGSAPTGTDND